jgi:hypothetical protein
MQERLLVVKRGTTTVIRCRLPNLQVQTSSFKRGYPENDSGRRHMRKVCISLATVILVILGTNLAIAQYKQTNLVADERGHAVYTCTGVSTVYRPHGKPLPIAVTILAAPTCPLAYSVRPPGWLPIPLRNSLFQRTENPLPRDSFWTPRTERSAGGTRESTATTRSPSSGDGTKEVLVGQGRGLRGQADREFVWLSAAASPNINDVPTSQPAN